jgi:hypothetical protein
MDSLLVICRGHDLGRVIEAMSIQGAVGGCSLELGDLSGVKVATESVQRERGRFSEHFARWWQVGRRSRGLLHVGSSKRSRSYGVKK